MKKIHHIIKHTNKGFTLMEVMVSVTIFTIIVTIGMGSLMTIFKTLQKTRADRQTIDSISYVLDTMTRRIRTGKDYVPIGNSGILFNDQEGATVSFYSGIDNNVNRLYMTDTSLGNQIGPFDITPENFDLQSFNIEIVGQDSSDGIQPLVKINLVGFVKTGQQQSRLAVQTIVSQRFLDFPAIAPQIGGADTTGLKNTGSASFGPGNTLTDPLRKTERPIDTTTTTSTATQQTVPTDTTMKALNGSRI